MIKINDTYGKKIGTIEDDKTARKSGELLGHVESSGEIFDKENKKVGHVRFSDGYVFDYQNNHKGTVHSDGSVVDYNGRPIGKILGDPVGLGGAVLLLLLEQ